MEVDFLLINPWIYDFSAYDFWLKPYGLLYIGGKLRKLGYKLYYLDLLDPFNKDLPKAPKRREFGTGHFYKEPVPKPYFFQDVPRRFYRYGLPFKVFKHKISGLKFKAVLLTCTLTYWYPGLFSVLNFLAKNYSKIPIYIGGIYPKLCKEHLAEFLSQYKDLEVYVVTQNDTEFLTHIKSRFLPSGETFPNEYPIFDLQTQIPYVVLMTSLGCPFNCPYCASKRIYPSYQEKSPEEVWEEVLFWHQNYGVKDFAFYDDALLFNFEKRLKPFLEKVISSGLHLRFHTPNAVHARFINQEVALLLKQAGFTTIRLGLERVENRFDQKVNLDEFLEAVSYLKKAGFSPKELGAYLLYGIPEENFKEVEKAIYFLEKVEISPYLAEFSPIPGTPFFEMAKAVSRYKIEEDPIFHNNSIFPVLKNPNWEEIERIKGLAKAVRQRLTSL
ncbi:radical SAM protein [Thermodesulfobacterium sp. TA1]|uniref:B12-binding domain-containing radical SAM protein n=1 Tax=Thermodesulfobacterium sp. TA1 TaxID=2234087 RepID=UPI001231E52F|nr:radical SAM protein [Thermodesulfobacterium sp. TA1]QER41404.1 radical SAM protein [Thermodesulfobacterium sp. TA1]